ncbi:uncharacterized protein LOC133730519 [Rosa rugosa]|uniref:uncharacterized protein LOC133730519 n=1 Tax=Rosa rugosa TaxID=74645 RepID=UPI002B40971C|nr:uncharacterized protein LOC133730519 [Rosa rugosa]
MAKVLIKPEDPEFTSIPNEILNNSRYMPHFKDCIGVIDGVHVQASISPWWEGTAHDSRVFLSAFRNPRSNFTKPPNGKYYVVDAGYPQMKGFLGPYKDMLNNIVILMKVKNYSSDDNNDEMKDNAYEEDGPGRQEMEMLRNTIA